MVLSLDLFEGRRIAVIGDVMLDCYLSGDVTRISPEAPVPVLRVANEKVVPGGAANVAANLASLGIATDIVGIIGEDAAARDLTEALRKHGNVDCCGLILSTRPTTRKLRVISTNQQIVRIDHEETGACDPATEAALVEAAERAIDKAAAVIISDYGKGVCTERVLGAIITRATALSKPVIVDPKQRDLLVYRGATILTPNRSELADATGLLCETDEEALRAAQAAQKMCDAAILLTRSEKGMSFFPIHGAALHVPTVAQDVFDVSGAGDTVVAVLGAGLISGFSMPECIRMANHAAGIVVSKLGTATVSREELSLALMRDGQMTPDADGGLVDLTGAMKLRAAWEQDRLTVGITNGCFDLLHPGHVSLIKQAAANCDRLIVALNSDASVHRLKGASRPIQDETARAIVIGAIKGVAAVLLFEEDTPLAVIRALQPDVLIKGADYTIDRVVGADTVLARGGRVILAELIAGKSTSRLVDAVKKSGVDG